MTSKKNTDSKTNDLEKPALPSVHPATQNQSQTDLRIAQDTNGFAALGRVVSYMMTKPSFAAQPFGAWSRILTGQINRKHYFFAMQGAQVVGFAGWALVKEDKARAWMDNRGEISSTDSMDGDCFVINAWGADSLTINKFILRELRPFAAPHRLVFAKRFYKDGRTRPVHLSVNEFLDGHQ